MPSLLHINLSLRPPSLSFLPNHGPLPQNHAFSLHVPPISSFHLWAMTVLQVTLNLSILEQEEISEASLHFIAKDTEIQRGELVLFQITGQVSAFDSFFITIQEEEKYWFWHKLCPINKYLLSNFSSQQWVRHWGSRNKWHSSELSRRSESSVGSEHAHL